MGRRLGPAQRVNNPFAMDAAFRCRKQALARVGGVYPHETARQPFRRRYAVLSLVPLREPGILFALNARLTTKTVRDVTTSSAAVETTAAIRANTSGNHLSFEEASLSALRTGRCRGERRAHRAGCTRNRPEGANPSGRGSERTRLRGGALRSFMGYDVAEDEATRSSTCSLYLPVAAGTTCV
jgi:hypothetical protein